MIELFIDKAALDKEIRRVESEVLRGGVRAVREATRGLEKDLEGVTRAAVPGLFYRAWKSETYPDKDIAAYDPSGVVFVNGRWRTEGAVKYWTTPGVNRQRDGGYLAIPTKNAGVLTRDRNLSPAEWERRSGMKLRYVHRGGSRPALLVADYVYSGLNGRGVRAATAGRAARNYARATRRTRVIFVLIREQRHANKFSIVPLVERAKRNLAAAIERNARPKSS